MISPKTLASFREYITSLYEQGMHWTQYPDHPTTPDSEVIYHISDYDR
jgi:hypothetical protein